MSDQVKLVEYENFYQKDMKLLQDSEAETRMFLDQVLNMRVQCAELNVELTTSLDPKLLEMVVTVLSKVEKHKENLVEEIKKIETMPKDNNGPNK
uniref:(California timema) hypothetical protein n=1 Tax=Timema californicum TaxID=61474 RepID=A0A7R9P6Z6_TIMCA|nr:unnamed protein product [Timema californicum]